jgi:hypothetical protein
MSGIGIFAHFPDVNELANVRFSQKMKTLRSGHGSLKSRENDPGARSHHIGKVEGKYEAQGA